jgi:post-segregation antitoxin (ccd killing protein)
VFSAAQAENEAGSGIVNRLQSTQVDRWKSEHDAVAKGKPHQDYNDVTSN